MNFKKAGIIWVIMFMILSFIYITSAYTIISAITNKIGFYGLGEILSVILLIFTIALISFLMKNPSILFLNTADQKRALITKKIWDDINYIPEEKLDLLKEKFSDVINSI
jgi:hypothetical protein